MVVLATLTSYSMNEMNVARGEDKGMVENMAKMDKKWGKKAKNKAKK
jgi:hypothetical protein